MRALPRGSDGHGASHGSGAGQIGGSGVDVIGGIDAGAAELVGGHAGDSVRYAGVAIDVGDIHVAGDVDGAETAAVDSRAVPGMEALIRGKRDPADVTESEAHAEAATTPAEEPNQRGPPVIGTVD